MCLVLLDLDIFPFDSSRMALLLSWYMMLSVMSYPYAYMKCLVYCTCGIASCVPISSASVELFTFILCFQENLVTAPPPMLIIYPVLPLQSSCISEDASTYHLIMNNSSAVKVSFRLIVSLRYLRTRLSLNQSSSSSFLTLVVRNATAVWIYLRARADSNNSCATVR